MELSSCPSTDAENFKVALKFYKKIVWFMKSLLIVPPNIFNEHSFFLEDNPTPGPQCGQKDYVNEKFQ
jgi:hypothetical protein